MKLQKLVFNMLFKLKPVLVRIFPISFLRKVKSIIVRKNLEARIGAEPKAFDRLAYKEGINLIGSIRAQTGLGQSCRLVANELEHSGLTYCVFNYDPISALTSGDISWEGRIVKEPIYNINIIHINPHELGVAYIQLDKKVWDHRYNIGFWLWELEEFPEEWTKCFRFLDEIWTPSEFISQGIRKKTILPVKTIPYCIVAPIDIQYDRDYFQLPSNEFLYLMMYDSNSIIERKNPQGVIDAFKEAFLTENVNVGLVIKINSAQKHDILSIRKLIQGYRNIYFITENLDKTQVNSLIKCVDVLVSLHRAEGFGLVLAEAMLIGTPTIATNWSANTEFMNNDVACMVDYEYQIIEKDLGPFKKGQRWANPNIKQAAYYMRKLFQDHVFYNYISKNSLEYAENMFCVKHSVHLIEERIQNILDMYK